MSRRKVVSSHHLYGEEWRNRFVCTLDCGHRDVHATGRHDRSGMFPRTVPPKTVTCWECEKAAKAKAVRHG